MQKKTKLASPRKRAPRTLLKMAKLSQVKGGLASVKTLGPKRATPTATDFR